MIFKKNEEVYMGGFEREKRNTVTIISKRSKRSNISLVT